MDNSENQIPKWQSKISQIYTLVILVFGNKVCILTTYLYFSIHCFYCGETICCNPFFLRCHYL